jgi:hypothetical protein
METEWTDYLDPLSVAYLGREYLAGGNWGRQLVQVRVNMHLLADTYTY